MNETHIFCTSIQCAASLVAMGAELRQQDPITITVDENGESIKFWFTGAGKYGSTKTLMDAYQYLARNESARQRMIITGDSQKIASNPAHPIHSCYGVMSARYYIHSKLNEVIAGGGFDRFKGEYEEYISTKSIGLSSVLHASGYELKSIESGSSYTFFNAADEKAEVIVEAFSRAWNEIILPLDHPVYFMKATLEHRSRFLDLRKNAPKMVVVKNGSKTGIFPSTATPENIKKLFNHAK